jgi:hypothetical protein
VLLVILFGHFDDPPTRGYPIWYQISLISRVQKLSRRSKEKHQ